jgi:predicted mannosyl-3-phosphoglycerate phosphatase (HAD superfamily)
MTFGHARQNFYEAARSGLAARMLWPTDKGVSPEEIDGRSLVLRLLPVAFAGLVDNGVDADEAEHCLSTIRERAVTGRTGARWQRASFEAVLDATGDRDRAAVTMLQRYQELSEAGSPVHTWGA